MLQLTPHIPIFIFHKPIDFRCGIDKLAILSRQFSDIDPYSGTLFMFRNRRSTSAKLLLYDGSGFWLCQKRLSTGRFPWWPGDQQSSHLDHHQIAVLLEGLDPRGLKAIPWRKIETTRDVRQGTTTRPTLTGTECQ